MTDLEKMKSWLMTFPGWEGTLEFDFTDALPGSIGLYPRGLVELNRREDVLGNVKVRYQYRFCLRRTAGTAGDNAQWLLDLQTWAAEQDALGLPPKFGDEPRSERLRAFEGKLDSQSQVGVSHYTVMLTAEFTKLFRGE